MEDKGFTTGVIKTCDGCLTMTPHHFDWKRLAWVCNWCERRRRVLVPMRNGAYENCI